MVPALSGSVTICKVCTYASSAFRTTSLHYMSHSLIKLDNSAYMSAAITFTTSSIIMRIIIFIGTSTSPVDSFLLHPIIMNMQMVIMVILTTNI